MWTSEGKKVRISKKRRPDGNSKTVLCSMSPIEGTMSFELIHRKRPRENQLETNKGVE